MDDISFIRETVTLLRDTGNTHDAEVMERGLDRDISTNGHPLWLADQDARILRRVALCRTLRSQRGIEVQA